MADTPSKKLEKKVLDLQQKKSLLKSRLNSLRIENNPNSKSREQKTRETQIEDIERKLIEIEHEIKAQSYHLNRLKGIESLDSKGDKPSDSENREIPQEGEGAYGGSVDDPAFRASRTLNRTPPLGDDISPNTNIPTENIPETGTITSTATTVSTPVSNINTTSANQTSNIYTIPTNKIPNIFATSINTTSRNFPTTSSNLSSNVFAPASNFSTPTHTIYKNTHPKVSSKVEEPINFELKRTKTEYQTQSAQNPKAQQNRTGTIKKIINMPKPQPQRPQSPDIEYNLNTHCSKDIIDEKVNHKYLNQENEYQNRREYNQKYYDKEDEYYNRREYNQKYYDQENEHNNQTSSRNEYQNNQQNNFNDTHQSYDIPPNYDRYAYENKPEERPEYYEREHISRVAPREISQPHEYHEHERSDRVRPQERSQTHDIQHQPSGRFSSYVDTPHRFQNKQLSRNEDSFRETNDRHNSGDGRRIQFSAPNTYRQPVNENPNHNHSAHSQINARQIRMENYDEDYHIRPNQMDEDPHLEPNEENFDYRNRNIPRTTFLKRLKGIPSFEGDTYKELKKFITKADTLYQYARNKSEEDEFFQQMMFQLGEEPRNLLITMNDPSWETIKQKLMKHFSYLSNKEILTSQIENLRQEKDESLTKYVERVRQLLREKNSTHSFMSEDLRKEHDRVARRAFVNGIKDRKLQNVMIIRGSKSLEDAITHALEAENDAFNQIPRSDLYCRSCKTTGHRESNCRNKDKESKLDPLISALRAITNLNGNNRNQNPNWNRNFNGGRNFNGNRNSNWNRNFNGNSNRNFNNNWNPSPNRIWNSNWNQNLNNDNFNRIQPRPWINNNNNIQRPFNNGNQPNNNNGNRFDNNNRFNNGNNNNGNGNNNFRNNNQNNNQNRNWQPNNRQEYRSNNFASIFNQPEHMNQFQHENDSENQFNESEN